MTIKTECVIKHLKHDYMVIAKGIGIAVGSIITILVACVIATNSYLIFNPLAALIVPHWTALNVLNVILGIIAIRYTAGIAVFGDENSFVGDIEEESAYDHSKVLIRYEASNIDVLFEPLLLGAGVITVYLFPIFTFGFGWELPVLSTFIFAVVVVAGTPAACAIARCKE